MIKLIAAIIMVIDHAGVILFSNNEIMRTIGRIAMPLYGYCIARGFYYSELKNTTIKKYVRNILIFAVISQIPYSYVALKYFKVFWLNIGFVWLFSIIILKASQYVKLPLNKKSLISVVVIIAVIIASFKIPIEYGLYGVLTPIIFYFCLYKYKSYLSCFLLFVALNLEYLISACLEKKIHLRFMFKVSNQYYALIAILIVLVLKNVDKKLLPKKFFYWFYPVQFIVLILVALVCETFNISLSL